MTPEERRAAIKAAKAMNLGIAGVDIACSERGPLVLEVNASPGFGIEQATGRDVATPIIEYVERGAKTWSEKRIKSALIREKIPSQKTFSKGLEFY